MKTSKTLLFLGLLFFQSWVHAETLCGKAVSLVLKADKEANVKITDKFILKDEFCDTGSPEVQSNFKISFFDETNKVIFEKGFFAEQFSHFEQFDDKKSGKPVNNKITKEGFERILKIPFNDKMKTTKKYQITSLKDQKTFTGEIKW